MAQTKTIEDDGKRYVRLQPYDKRKGHECLRHTIGGRTFEAPNWYVMDPGPAALLADRRQGNESEEAPLLFQVCTRAEYEREVQRDMRRGLAEVAGGGLADADAPLPPALSPPKSGPSEDKFKGMFDDAKDVPAPRPAVPAGNRAPSRTRGAR